jgi:predicted SprT family Zn-dependent metalloprotease
MSINPSAFFSLQKYTGLKSSEVTVQHVQEIAAVFGHDISGPVAMEIVGIAIKDPELDLLEWIFNPVNLERFKQEMMTRQSSQTFLLECPHCGKLNVKPVMAVPVVDRHVICNHCRSVIDLED